MDALKLPSISKWPRVMRCAASAVLPALEPEQSEFSTVGRLVHRFIERAAVVGRDGALAEIPAEEKDAIRFCEALPLDELPVATANFAHELPVLYFPDTDTAEQWDRDKPRPAGAIAGILDVVGVSAEAVYVGDFKTGWAWLGDPSENWQMRLGAVAAARLFNRQQAVVELISLRDDGGVYGQRGSFDGIDLDGIAHTVKERVDLLRELAEVERSRSLEGRTMREVREGPWCRYCPAFRGCPAKVAMLNAVLQSPAATIDSIKANLTVANAAAAYARYKLLKDMIGEIGKAIYAFAGEHPIPTENGMVLKLVHGERESVDGEVVYRLMREQYGEAVADQAVERSSSKAAIEDVFRTLPREKGQTIKALKEGFLEQLRAAGGIATKPSDSVKEVRA